MGALGVLRQFIGPDIRSLVVDVTPAALTTIDAEFERVAALAPPSIKVVSAGGDGGPDPMDDIFPRVDISEQVDSLIAVFHFF